jgi:hypothetical protein
VRGDQLIFFYDAREGRVPFLNVSNPSTQPVAIDFAFYPENLAARIGTVRLELPGLGHEIVDPTTIAGGAVTGQAGLAVVTPIVSTSDPRPVVPPAPLVGSYTLANLTLGSGFGENPMGRRAVNSIGEPAAPGSDVDGGTIRYQRFHPLVLAMPGYFNPQTLGPPENDGNRVILAAFTDAYGSTFEIGAASRSATAVFRNTGGAQVATGPVNVSGVLLSNLQSLAGATTLDSSGKLFLELADGDGNVFGIYSQSLATFASGGRMPAVDALPVS